MVPLNSRILIIRTPKMRPLIFGNSHIGAFILEIAEGGVVRRSATRFAPKHQKPKNRFGCEAFTTPMRSPEEQYLQISGLLNPKP